MLRTERGIALDTPQNDRDPDVEAARRRARRLAWVLGLVALALYLGFILTRGGGQ